MAVCRFTPYSFAVSPPGLLPASSRPPPGLPSPPWSLPCDRGQVRDTLTSLRSRRVRHLEALAAEHQVRLSFVPGGFRAAEAFPPSVAAAPNPVSGALYLTGLHELGHCVSPEALAFVSEPGVYARFCCEAASWAWAAAVADESLYRPGDWALAGRCLTGYLEAFAPGSLGA